MWRSSSSCSPILVFLPYTSLVEATRTRAPCRSALSTMFSVPCRLVRRLSSVLSRMVKVPTAAVVFVVFACSYRAPANVTPAIENEFNRTFKVIRALPCDVPLGDHPAQYNMMAKHARLKPGAPNPFIDAANCWLEADPANLIKGDHQLARKGCFHLALIAADGDGLCKQLAAP